MKAIASGKKDLPRSFMFAGVVAGMIIVFFAMTSKNELIRFLGSLWSTVLLFEWVVVAITSRKATR